MVAAAATCLTVNGCAASRRSTRILLNGNPVRSTTARRQPSRLSMTSAESARQASSASRSRDTGALRITLGHQRRQSLG
jgi:hypothetical protein